MSHPESKVLFTVGQFADPCKHDSQCRHEDEEGLVRLETGAGNPRLNGWLELCFQKMLRRCRRLRLRGAVNDKDADVDEQM